MPMKFRFQKSIPLLLAALCVCTLVTFTAIPSASAATSTWYGGTATSFAGGTGTSASPYLIATADQLAYMKALINSNNELYNAPGVYYKLTTDIDLNHIQWTAIGADHFYANFNGNGHIIYNFTIGTSGSYYDDSSRPQGFFRQVDGTVENLGLENVDMYVYSGYNGPLAGTVNSGALVQNCYATGSLQSVSSNSGGLVGGPWGSSDFPAIVRNCASSVNVESTNSIGGLIGRTGYTTVSNSFGAGNVSSPTDSAVAGFVGTSQSTYFEYAYWNIDASQIDANVARADAAKLGLDLDYGGNSGTTTSMTSADMKSQTFVDLLNAHSAGLATWTIVDGYNNGYPIPFSPPAISLNPSTDKTFTAQTEGYGPQTAHSVTVTNTGSYEGTGQLYVWLSGDDKSAYSLSVSTIASIAAGGSSNFTVQPVTGLSAGTYTATVNVTGEEVAGKTFDVSFTVLIPTYTISADPTSLDFGAVGEGYAPAPDAQTVVITNTGNQTVTVTLPTDANYDITTSDSLTLAPSATANVSVRPKTGLAIGTYDPTLTFTTDHTTSVNVDAAFTVATPDYTISADPASLDFGTEVEGYSPAPAAQTVTVTNTGNLPVELTLPVNANFDITTVDSTSLEPTESATVSIRPKTGLAAGTYNPTLSFTTDHATSADVAVTFTVETPDYSIEASKTSLDFGTSVEGYSPAPAAQTVVITNTGNLTVELTLPTDPNYDITTLDSTTLAPSATATVSIRPKTNLSPGTYDPTLTFTTDHATSADVDATFTVIEAVYGITASPTEKDFGNLTVGYAPVAPITVTVTNIGNKIITLTQPAGVSYTVGSLSKTVLNPDDFATFDLGPSTGLPVGAYPETIAISGSQSTSASVEVRFVVDPIIFNISGNDSYYYHSADGLVLTSNGEFANFTGVTMDGVVVAPSNYSAVEGSTIVTLYPSYLDTLLTRGHRFRMLFTNGYAEMQIHIGEVEIPKTGDSGNIALFVLLAIAALSGAYWLRRRLRRQ